MIPYPPTLQEAIALIAKLAAHLKQLPFDVMANERRRDTQDADEMVFRHNSAQESNHN